MKYRATISACYLGYMIQAVVNTFVPLLLLTFQEECGVTTLQLTLLVTFNFLVQLLTDLCSPLFIDRIGYRASAVGAHLLTLLGLGGLAFIPALFPLPFIGLLLCVFLYAVGGGLLEVVISPIIEALPLENKEKHMSILHSFYCWGQVAVILFSSLFFALFGIAHWRILAIFWASLACLNVFLFCKCPILPLIKEGNKGDGLLILLKKPVFWITVFMMICSGASNNGVSQWLSTFMEETLGLPKSVGDLAGPCCFALLMGTSRVLYAKFSVKIKLENALVLSSFGCILSYLLISLPQSSLLTIVGCLLCGFSVGLLWPGTFSVASSAMPSGGTLLFAFLALAGDVGCAAGPGLVGVVTELSGNMRIGIAIGAIFPISMFFFALYLWKKSQRRPPLLSKNNP